MSLRPGAAFSLSSFFVSESSAFNPADLVPPPVMRLFKSAELVADAGDVFAVGQQPVGQQPVGLGERADHLLGCAGSSLSS